jgi:type IV secretion system protein VirB6
MSFVGDIYNNMVQKFQEPIAKNAAVIASEIKPLVMSCFLLYVLFLVYKLYTNKDFIIEEMVNAMLLFAVIGTFTYGGNYYYSYVIPFVQNSGDQIASSLVGGSSSSLSTVDVVYDIFEVPLKELREELDDVGLFETYVGKWLQLAPTRLCLWLSQTIFTLVVAINLLIAKVMITLLLSVGIIFFCFAIFPSTRGLFTSYTGLALNYILLNVMYSVAAKIAESVITSTTGGTSAAAMMGAAGTILISTVIIVLAVNQIPSMVSSLTGGVGISPFTISGIVRNAGIPKILSKTAGKVGKSAGKYAGSKAKSTWNKMRGNGSATNK